MYLPEISGVSFLPSPPHCARSWTPRPGCKPRPKGIPGRRALPLFQKNGRNKQNSELRTQAETRTSFLRGSDRWAWLWPTRNSHWRLEG